MSEYNIEKADFDKQKIELKRFAEQPATSTKLDKFSTSGQWSDFWSGGIAGVLSGHKVTGEELNNLVVELQSCFAEINERDRKLTKEFGQVYETFEALDKGYIQGILIGVKSAEKASQEAKEAQKDIDDTIEALQKTITKLKEFKDEVNKNKHLDDIDQMWSDILQINSFIVKLKELEHISDIDTAWEYSHNIGVNTEILSNKLSEAEDEIKRCKESLTLHENEKTHMKQRINIAYIVAGSAMAISIIQMCLLFMGVL